MTQQMGTVPKQENAMTREQKELSREAQTAP